MSRLPKSRDTSCTSVMETQCAVNGLGPRGGGWVGTIETQCAVDGLDPRGVLSKLSTFSMMLRCLRPSKSFVVVFGRSVVSSCLQPHGLQHSKHPCPSLSPGVCLKPEIFNYFRLWSKSEVGIPQTIAHIWLLPVFLYRVKKISLLVKKYQKADSLI